MGDCQCSLKKPVWVNSKVCLDTEGKFALLSRPHDNVFCESYKTGPIYS